MIGSIREIATSLGAGTGVVGLAMVIVIQISGRILPTASDGANVVTMGMATFAAGASLLSGLAMVISRTLVRTGCVETKGAIILRGVEAGLCAGAFFAMAAFLFFYVPGVAGSGRYDPQDRIAVTPGIVMYTLLPVLAMILTAVNLVVAHRLFFPTVEKVQKHLARESG
ncbi:hypothetical protein [Amycolatopsis sp. EV170708-02-1]|uniref:hypothetical protein n=1 Tax=Amycolatopsis sp. EV170708-02-1 TaxID=2919322 RepID=UPI001F0C266D|nr:hypothetical protein [Amycolatopsis sp. EV170708-02-1]UMP04984.1 hypothetical protein MJQ72_09185 [Amycolatopsis sp. EV170708-02-1]